MTHRVFDESPIADTRPAGWVKRFLELQRHGLTGHLEAAGYPFDTKLWACPAIPFRHGAPWWPYEQTAYWIDGFTRCGLLLNDDTLVKKARRQVEYVLKHADRDGYLGPRSCKPFMPAGRWSHMIFFRALIAWFQATGDTRIVPALQRHYLGHAHDHSGHRDVCNIEIMCWVYERTGNARLLRMAEETWARYQQTGEDDDVAQKSAILRKNTPADSHGVTFCETIKQGAILYMATGKKHYLQDTLNGFRKLDRFHMLPSGAPSSTEHLRGRTSLDAHETCDIADYTWSAGHLLMATGDATLADRIERAAFNALPGAVTKDFRALQYFSGPNQVVLARNSCHTLAATGGKWMCYRPKPGTECCTGEVNRVMPNFGARMWLRKGDDPVAALYGPGTHTFERRGNQVTITEETCYPFGEEIDFSIDVDTPTRFTLWVRIPGWCRKAQVLLNGSRVKGRMRSGSFVPVTARFTRNDRVKVVLPMPLSLGHWPDGGITVERGPLVFALPIRERRVRDRSEKFQTNEFPAWEFFPESDWNYALCLNDNTLDEQVRVEFAPMTSEPWRNPPVRLVVPARKVKGWKVRRPRRMQSVGGKLIDPALNKWQMFEKTVEGDFLVTPPLPDPETLPGRLGKKVEMVTLVPHGCTLLRVGMFPQCE